MADLFSMPTHPARSRVARTAAAPEDDVVAPLEVFEAELRGQRRTNWPSLFQGYHSLKAITFSSSIPALLAMADLFEDMEVLFGSERVLGRELGALEDATALAGYRFTDLLADQKAAIEHLLRPALRRGGQPLLRRVQEGSLRFAVLRQAPSHEKLYLLQGGAGQRVILGSANLSLAALTGRQRETFVVFDGTAAYSAFADYAARDAERADAIRPELLVVSELPAGTPPANDAEPSELAVAAQPVPIEALPAVRSLEAGLVVVEQPRRIIAATPGAEALREAGRLGAELREMSLERDRKGATVVTARSLLQAWRTLTSKPVVHESDRLHTGLVDLGSGLVSLDGVPWHEIGKEVALEEVRRDAELLDAYMRSFAGFYGDTARIQRGYWALMAWLYAAPFAPLLRSAMTRHDGETFRYPVCGLVYGQSHGGKSHLSRVLVRSMFGVHKELPGRDFTTARALGLRDRMAAIPLVVDDLNNRKMTEHLPDLVKADREFSERYAPILISTNRDVQAVAPELRKRMVVVQVAGSKPKALSTVPAQRAMAIGTGLYRDYLNRLAPRIPEMLAAIAADPGEPPDLIACSAACLRLTLAAALGEAPDWAPALQSEDVDTLRDRPFLEALAELTERASGQVTVDRRAGVMSLRFAGDTNAALRFEKLVPAQVLRGRIADALTLDLVALERECGYAAPTAARFWLNWFRKRS
ncbi:phospholipase D family protein [Paracraurococcus lichenis]|uniref:Phospholipase D family protein n=1 Tax=Paracraurococcus lichenis TaxID=3064888 RepID=A0ABT9EBN5_9PROT|nr:phospholipase D family protein [Paracraurococcus sp. LOR1-02]MDO9713616.1 phospholipase D family protein [Paracraurococcus sp. LOR1-02]